ncbi:MAG: ABC transporter transmembrane domain-containing protein, partial [Acidobacteriota bacterium]
MRPETRQALLEAGAESIDAGGNRPIRLDAAYSWWVDTGRVEIFALRTDPGARGPRTHVATLDAGQVAFGMEARREARLPFGRVETRDAKAALLAIGLPDTKLLKLPLTALVRLAQNPEHVPDLASAIEEWLSALFQQVPRSGAPKKFEALRRNSEVTLESEGEASRTASGVVWVRHVEGSSRFLGREELAMKPAGHLLPLSDETWMVSAEPAVLSCVGTGKLVRSGTVWESLARFHELFLEYVEMQVAVERDEERERLERKLDLDRETLATASRRLASVLDDRGELGELRGAAAGGDTEPLVDACQLVGDVLGIEFTAPEEDQGTGGHRYSLSRVCAYSRVRHRLVMLRGEWWSLDNGPLLAFRKDPEADERSRLAGHPVALLPKSAESYEIVDPATGERTPATAETAESLEAEAFMFYPPLPERPLKIRDLVSLAARGRRRDLVTLLLMGMGAGLLGLLVPILTGQIFGVVIPSAERSQLWQMTVALGAAAFASLAFQLTRSIAVLRVSGKLDGTLQAAVWDRLLALPAGFFRQFSVGDLAARSMGIDHIRGLLLGNVTTSLLGAVFSVFSFALLFYYSAR